MGKLRGIENQEVRGRGKFEMEYQHVRRGWKNKIAIESKS